MRKTVLGWSFSMAFLLSACAGSAIGAPKVIYSNSNGIGVRYHSTGITGGLQEDEALSIIQAHCNNKFQITGRSLDKSQTVIDAICL
jgi:hypothetical protein